MKQICWDCLEKVPVPWGIAFMFLQDFTLVAYMLSIEFVFVAMSLIGVLLVVW